MASNVHLTTLSVTSRRHGVGCLMSVKQIKLELGAEIEVQCGRILCEFEIMRYKFIATL
jgi:hypothetical protein